MNKRMYGQFCPIAISLELLGGRWTFLIMRELLSGSSRFNDIHRGVPRMSRSLLSDRLKNLEAAKLISRSRKSEYMLTDGGRALGEVIKSMGMWGQEWLHTALALDEVDGGYLMWSIKQSTRWIEEMGKCAVVRFEFSDWGEKHRFHWYVIEKGDVELCYVDPGLDVDVWIETDLRTMVDVWMGWRRLSDAIEKKDIALDGPPELVDDPLRWIGQSPVAGVSKRPSEERVGYLLEKVRP